jgi:hypothetical protein
VVVTAKRIIATIAMKAYDILKFMRGIVSWRRLRAQLGYRRAKQD